MADQLRWWVIPGGLVVMLRVVTLGVGDESPAGGRVAVDASEPPGMVAVLEAAGQRVGPVVCDVSAAGALVLTVPPGRTGQRGQMTIWRRLQGAREGHPWLVCKPRVRSDATVPVAGLPAGRYDVEMAFDDGEARRLAVDDAELPGSATLRAAP